MNKNLLTKVILSCLLVALAVSLRMIPHPANFAPIAALALFGGVYLGRNYAFILPVVAMLISDFFIGFYSLPVMTFVYGSFLLVGVMALWLRQHKKWYWTLTVTLAGSILFYLATNWAVWAFGVLYPHTLSGLMQSYTMALPFFRGTLLGDLFYVTAFFGSYELVRMLIVQFKLTKSSFSPVINKQ